jgi:hypothetical protein
MSGSGATEAACWQHYFNDMLLYRTQVIVLVWKQFEAKLMLLYDLAFCLLLTSLVGADDLRVLLVWTALFPGIALVIFSGASRYPLEAMDPACVANLAAHVGQTLSRSRHAQRDGFWRTVLWQSCLYLWSYCWAWPKTL